MKSRLQMGDSNMTGILILAVILIIIWVTPKDTVRQNNDEDGSSVGVTLTSLGSSLSPRTSTTRTSGNAPTSYASQHISIGTGNAAYSYQPYEEYITIENRGRASIDITNWQLRNGKDERAYYLGGTLQRFSADIALIPQATLFPSPTGASTFQNVVLDEGERAIITSGSTGVQSPYKIASFKENICTGYLEAMTEYAFTPPLTRNCPRPALEPGIESLDSECRTFLSTLSSCDTPKFEVKNQEGDTCSTCIKGKRLSNSCAAFIQEHFSYRGCAMYHASDLNFSGRTWRVFLGRGWEMWAKEYETIELFDRLGQLVSFQSY